MKVIAFLMREPVAGVPKPALLAPDQPATIERVHLALDWNSNFMDPTPTKPVDVEFGCDAKGEVLSVIETTEDDAKRLCLTCAQFGRVISKLATDELKARSIEALKDAGLL